jgi:hypothetical protein
MTQETDAAKKKAAAEKKAVAAAKKKAAADAKKDCAKLKKENRTMILFHPTKGDIDFSTASKEFLLELSTTKGYEHLFEKPIKKK